MAPSGPSMVNGATGEPAPTNGYGMRRLVSPLALVAALALVPSAATAQSGQKRVTARAASGQGPYPVGHPSAQPDLRFAFPAAETGARDQTFRLIVTPDIWGRQARLRLSN